MDTPTPDAEPVICLSCNTAPPWLGPARMVLSNTFKYRCPNCGWTRSEDIPK